MHPEPTLPGFEQHRRGASMIPGLILKTKSTRTVVMVSEIEPGCFMVEPMHFLTLQEAKRQAEAALPRARKAGLV